MVSKHAERRHRLHGDEVSEGIEGFRLRIIQHLKTRENLYKAQVAFRAFYRLSTHCIGKPNYPSHDSWEELSLNIMNNGTITREEDARARVWF